MDAACDAAFLEAVRAALLAALLAAGPATLFGLATCSRRVALWDLQGAAPAVRLVPLAPDMGSGEASCALELADALPLEAVLAPRDVWRDEAEAALEALRADERGSGGPRAFGAALDALLSMLGAPGGAAQPLGAPPPPTFPSVRVLAFLSGPPNAGAGALDGARWEEAAPALAAAPSAAAAEAALTAADALARPQTEFYAEAGARAAVRPRAAHSLSFPPTLCMAPRALSYAHSRAQAGNIVVEVFALPPAGGRACLDLASLAPLPRACGGALFHYPNGPGDAPLARDVHRLLRRADAAAPHAAPRALTRHTRVHPPALQPTHGAVCHAAPAHLAGAARGARARPRGSGRGLRRRLPHDNLRVRLHPYSSPRPSAERD